MTQIIGELEKLQSEIINVVHALSDDELRQQYHPDLSPIGWHLGHCIYIESYWIREQLLNQTPVDEALQSLYVPEMSLKQNRGNALPNKTTIINWAEKSQLENKNLLEKRVNNPQPHHLLENDYLFHFLVQHYSQHLETIKMIQTEIQLGKKLTANDTITFLTPTSIQKKTIKIRSGSYQIGSSKKHFPYDNEHPAQNIKLDSFEVACLPVSNAEYLSFINDAGYSRKELWSNDGWKWITKNQIKHPHHWRFDQGWYGINHQNVYSLIPEQAVYGLNQFEATAYAKWASARLPHEYELETAYKENTLEQTYSVWEWCNNHFHPYPGFTAYPYKGYSSPYFDGKHYVLKGGSCYTKPAIRRSSFRNYYTADKRHIFAGLRLIYE